MANERDDAYLYELLAKQLAGTSSYRDLVVKPQSSVKMADETTMELPGELSFKIGSKPHLFEKQGIQAWRPVRGEDVPQRIEALKETGVKIDVKAAA